MDYFSQNNLLYHNSPTCRRNKCFKFWAVWLPMPTFLAIIISIIFTWLILNTVGYIESPIEKAGERITEQF